MRLSLVVPVFNAEGSLDALHERVCAVMAANGYDFELLLVEDCSRDQSWSRIEQLAARDPRVRGMRMSRNRGQQAALLCGVRAATGEIVVTLDDDLQNPPEEIPRMLAKLTEGFDVVYGTPQKQRHGLWRDLASSLTKAALTRVMGVENADAVSAFRVFRTSLRNAFQTYDDEYVMLDVLLAWGTARFGSVLVQHDERRIGVSNYTFMKLVVHALTMITGFSTVPLHVASLLGLTLTGFGMVLLVWVVGRTLLFGSNVSGFPFIASAVSLFSGAQLFALGVIGEYLGRVHQRSMRRPPIVVRSTVGFDPTVTASPPWPLLERERERP